MRPRLFDRKIFSANGDVTPFSAPNSFHSPEKIRKMREAPEDQDFSVFE
jgi:hypothetical protein